MPEIVVGVKTVNVGSADVRKIIALTNKDTGEVLDIARFYTRPDLVLMGREAEAVLVAKIAEGLAAHLKYLIADGAGVLSAERWKLVTGDEVSEGLYSSILDSYLKHERILSFMSGEDSADWVDTDPLNPPTVVTTP